MTTSVAFKTSPISCVCTAADITSIDQEAYNMMEDISLGTESGFKTML